MGILKKLVESKFAHYLFYSNKDRNIYAHNNIIFIITVI